MNKPALSITRVDRLWRRLIGQWYAARLRRAGVELGSGSLVDAGVEIAPGLNCQTRPCVATGRGCQFSRGVVIHTYGGKVRLGENVFLGPFAVLYGHGGVDIGDETLISMHCRILSSAHTIPPAGKTIRSQPDQLQPTRIGRDVWLGAGVTVLGGVSIGDGCVVGAGAVVAGDLPPNSISIGVPAKTIRFRG